MSLSGVPLPLIGMIAYGLVTNLALQLAGKELPFRVNETNGRLILLATTTSMATASTYFLYVLSTSFPGDSCAYCLFSALLSFGLLFTTLKVFIPLRKIIFFIYMVDQYSKRKKIIFFFLIFCAGFRIARSAKLCWAAASFSCHRCYCFEHLI